MATIDHELTLLLLEYCKSLEKRLIVLEEDLNRYDFGYDALDTILKKIQEKYPELTLCHELKMASEGDYSFTLRHDEET